MQSDSRPHTLGLLTRGDLRPPTRCRLRVISRAVSSLLHCFVTLQRSCCAAAASYRGMILAVSLPSRHTSGDGARASRGDFCSSERLRHSSCSWRHTSCLRPVSSTKPVESSRLTLRSEAATVVRRPRELFQPIQRHCHAPLNAWHIRAPVTHLRPLCSSINSSAGLNSQFRCRRSIPARIFSPVANFTWIFIAYLDSCCSVPDRHERFNFGILEYIRSS